MKRVLFLFFLLSSLSAGAQSITYDTIRVSPDDKRNIHRNRPVNNVAPANKPLRKGNVNAGRQPSAFDINKLRFGVDLGLSISNNYTNVGFGPQIGYEFSQYFMAGAGIRYYYNRSRTYDYEIKSNLLGANLFGYIYPVNFITVFLQPEINYIWSNLKPRRDNMDRHSYKDDGVVPSMVVGAGFRLGRSHITLNYDLVQDDKSPHPDGLYLGVSAFF